MIYKQKFRITAFLIAVLLALAAVVGYRYYMGNFAAPFMPSSNVEAVTAKKATIAEQADAVGTVTSEKYAAIAAETNGRVVKIVMQEGGKVKSGDILILLDQTSTKSLLNQGKAAYDLAKFNFNRLEQLYKEKFVSKQAYDEGVANLSKAKADYEVALDNHNKTEIKAPFDGVVGLKKVNEGDYITTGTIITMIDDASNLYVNFKLSQDYLNKIQLDNKVKIYSNSGKESIAEGIVANFESLIDEKDGGFGVKARITSNDKPLNPGNFVKVEVSISPKESITIPESALVRNLDGVYVFVIKDEAVKLTKVETGIRNDKNVEVLSGINEGDIVVSAGFQKIGDGAKVVIKELDGKELGGAEIKSETQEAKKD